MCFLLLSGSLVAAILVWISLKYFVLCSMSCNTYEYEKKMKQNTKNVGYEWNSSIFRRLVSCTGTC